MYNLCDTCTNVKLIDKNLFTKNNESWHMFPHHLPILGRKNGSQSTKIKFNKKYSNCLVYYWGSKNMIYNLNIEYPNSYKHSDNNGLVKLDDKGEATIFLDCPQPYKEDNISYMNHIHMLVSNKKMDSWSDNLFTQNILCNIGKNDVQKYLRNKNRLVINALSEEYHKKAHIPDSFNLYYKEAESMNKTKIINKIKNMVSKNTSVKELQKKYKLKIEEIPIVVYCYNKTCDAGHNLANALFKNGFTNILDYNGGIIDWFGR